MDNAHFSSIGTTRIPGYEMSVIDICSHYIILREALKPFHELLGWLGNFRLSD